VRWSAPKNGEKEEEKKKMNKKNNGVSILPSQLGFGSNNCTGLLNNYFHFKLWNKNKTRTFFERIINGEYFQHYLCTFLLCNCSFKDQCTFPNENDLLSKGS
jgi:hypothetical protein